MNTYLIVSDTNYFISEKLKELKNNISNIITFNLQENTIDEVLEEASYFSMFNDEKCIIIKNANFFSSSKKGDSKKSKEEADKLIKYLENENKNVKIIFITDSVDTKKKIYTLLNSNSNVFIYPKLSKTEMKNELNKIVTTSGYKIDDKSLWHIINNSFGNLDIAINEIKKIMLYYNKKCLISYDVVVKMTSKAIEQNNFKLVDSIINRNLEEALNYLEEARILRVEPSIILAMLYREFKLMLSVFIYEENKTKHQDILNNLKLTEWQYEKVKNNLRMYKKWELKEEIINLGKLDYQYKSGLFNKDLILINYILRIC